MKFTKSKTIALSLITLATVSLSFSIPAGHAAERGSWTHSTFKNKDGERDYYLYLPKSVKKGQPTPLMVMLHGCVQSAAELADLTGMNGLADAHGFAVLYPEQNSSANLNRCWNWYETSSQKKGSGELGIIVGMVGQVAKTVTLDSKHIGVVGFSAGAAMAANLMACHSDLFTGAVIHSGLEFEAATSMTEAFMAMSQGGNSNTEKTGSDAAHCVGSKGRLSNVLIIHGTSDYTVSPKNSALTVEQFTRTNDLLDDHQANNSQTTKVLKSEKGSVPNGRSYTVESFGGQGGVHIQRVLVQGMSHAWSGGRSGAQFGDSSGPNAAEMAWQFLMN